MKVLTLEFANLNSLEGRWCIDFTCPEYVADGIFAITGPTGSGKSTILDALCLALYGQTPRLGKITRSGNELMSRHAGDCFAEVTFSVASGTFRAHWSQHRSRRRAGAELQMQKHELSDADGNLLQSRVQETQGAIEELTGMDFDRFTRSILLAQGGFAAFLQADADRRAPVLEQITGTEVYSRISMLVHERHRAERARLELLRAATGGIRVLEPGELDSIHGRLDALLVAERNGQVRLDALLRLMRKREEVERLEAELSELRRQAAQLAAATERLEPDARRLMLAQKASSQMGRYTPMVAQRQELDRETAALSGMRQRQPGLAGVLDAATVAHDAAAAELQRAITAQDAQRPLLEKVGALDRQLAERQNLVAVHRQSCSEVSDHLESLERERASLAARIAASREELGGRQSWLADHEADGGIEPALSGIDHAVRELRAATLRRAATDVRLAAAVANLEAARQALAMNDAAVAASAARLADADSAISGIRADLDSLLDCRSLRELRLQLDGVRQRVALLESIAEVYAVGRTFAPKIDELRALLDGEQTRREGLRSEITTCSRLLEAAQRELALLEENLALSARVRSYEDERAALPDGTPCPLCGSTSHPYVSGLAALPSSDDTRLQQAKAALQEHHTTLRRLEIAIAGVDAVIGQRRQRLSELEQERAAYGQKCLQLLVQTGIADHPRQAEPAVVEALATAAGEQERLQKLVTAAELLDERLRSVGQQRQEALEACNADRRDHERCLARYDGAALELQRLEAEIGAIDLEVRTRRERLVSLIEPFGLDVDGVADPESDGIGLLESRSRQWHACSNRCRELGDMVHADTAAMQQLAAQLGATVAELARQKERLAAEELLLEACRTERGELFGDRDPLEVSGVLDGAVAAARERLDSLRTRLAETGREFAGLEAAIAVQEERIGRMGAELSRLETAFLDGVRSCGFADEGDFCAAVLGAAEVDALETVFRDIRRKAQELAALQQDRTERLGAAREALGEEPADGGEPAVVITALQEELGSAREEIGVLRRRLADDTAAAEELRGKLDAVSAQDAECRQWEQLHELIGSADGKKFRNFAQAMTFAVMIAHANAQLALMTDRYQLVGDIAAPLELNVIDTWQAGEVRSTRNLSGGESFIVSLALALGLSHLSSRNVRVDSLFLDEGFGTLDDEALETALETLSGLQQEGKLIGVISHVPAIRERIGTRIVVTPRNGGRSSLSGPGVRHGA